MIPYHHCSLYLVVRYRCKGTGLPLPPVTGPLWPCGPAPAKASHVHASSPGAASVLILVFPHPHLNWPPAARFSLSLLSTSCAIQSQQLCSCFKLCLFRDDQLPFAPRGPLTAPPSVLHASSHRPPPYSAFAMSAAYKQFLASPSSSLLAENASLHYITTLSNFAGATEIIKHLTALRRQVTKKQEEVLSLVEGQNAIVVEVLTALEFITSGGVYLPKLEDNFLSDRTAYVPIVSRSDTNYLDRLADLAHHLDTLCFIRRRRQNRTDSTAVGSGCSPEAA